MLGVFILPWIRDRFSSWRCWTSTASSAKLPKPTTAKEEKCLQCGKCDRLPHGLTGDTWLGTYLYVHIYIYYYIKLHYSIFDYILLFAYAYVNINIYLFIKIMYSFLYILMCVCHIQRRNWICDPLNDMRQDGLAQQLEQWRLTSSPSKNIKWHRFCQQKHVPFPQPRPCHVLGLEDYLPLKKKNDVWAVYVSWMVNRA